VGALAATRVNHSIGKRCQTNEYFYFGTRGSEAVPGIHRNKQDRARQMSALLDSLALRQNTRA
jgi:hypothetical protein